MGVGRGGRAPCCEKVGLNKGSWTPEEDVRLMAYVRKHGHANWRALPKQAGLLRCGKSCRLRWINYLRPDIKRGNFSWEEEDTIIRLHAALGNKWSKIASCLPGRTDNEIKNVWNTHLKKRLEDKKDRKPPATAAHDKSEEEPPSSPASSVVTHSSMSCSEQGESEHMTHANTNKEATIDEIEIPIEPNLDLCSSSSTMQGRPRGKSDKTSDLVNSPLLRTDSRSNVTWQEVGVAGDLPAGSACNKDQGTTKISSSGSDNPTLRTGPASIVILKDPLEEMPDISIEPEIWSMIEDEDEPSGGLGGGGGGGGGGESESERWLAYLEKELELWGDANSQEFGGDVGGGDPVTSYFHKSLSSSTSSSSSTPLDDLLYF